MLDIIKSYFNHEEYYIILLDNRLLVKNYKKLYELTDNNLIISVGNITYHVSGSNFSLIKNYHKDLEITGIIEAIEKV